MTKNYNWVEETLENVVETIKTGDPISFQFNQKDYFIEGENFDNEGLGRVGKYLIADANVQADGSFGEVTFEYPESGQYRTSDELLNAGFLDSKTLIERFGELRFFD